MAITMVVADDHESIRVGLMEVFRGTEITIAGVAADGDEALRLVRTLCPDVLIIDIRMPHRDGLVALEKILNEAPKTKVLVYSMYRNPTYIARAITLGAKDYLVKTESSAELLKTVRRIAGEDNPVAGRMVESIREKLQTRERALNPFTSLTNRELQVLRHVAFGLSNREIGISLGISVETVKEHVQNILRKVDVTDRTQAAVWAVKNELV